MAASASQCHTTRAYRPRLEALEDRTLLSACVVNSLGDTGAGSGAAGDLRYCITRAHAIGPATASREVITFAVAGTINLTKALPDLKAAIDIEGPGADLLKVQRGTGGYYRIFMVNGGANVRISGVTATNGDAYGGLGGSGIRNEGNLTVLNSVISGNRYFYSAGGGIFNTNVLQLVNSTVSGNQAWDGGGIYSTGALTVTSSTISGNTAYAQFDSSASGGGIYSSGSLYVSNSTISGNDVNGEPSRGGGIYGSGTILHSTITANTGGAPCGSGIYGSYVLRNTIVSGNSDFNNVCGGYTGTHNLIDGNAMLGGLGNNGGPTKTHAPLPVSPAIDSGDNTDAPEWDQRGAGYPRIVNDTIDIGAFEVQATGAPSTRSRRIDPPTVSIVFAESVKPNRITNQVPEQPPMPRRGLDAEASWSVPNARGDRPAASFVPGGSPRSKCALREILRRSLGGLGLAVVRKEPK